MKNFTTFLTEEKQDYRVVVLGERRIVKKLKKANRPTIEKPISTSSKLYRRSKDLGLDVYSCRINGAFVTRDDDSIIRIHNEDDDEGFVIDNDTIEQLSQRGIPAISEFDDELALCWFIPRNVTERKTKNGKTYWILDVIDSNNEQTAIRCWGIDPKRDQIMLNKAYVARLNYDPKWGFSTRALGRTFRML